MATSFRLEVDDVPPLLHYVDNAVGMLLITEEWTWKEYS